MSHFIKTKLETGETQEQITKRIKATAHKLGYSYRSKVRPDGSISLTIQKMIKKSERNMRKVIKVVDKMKPVIVWLDEIEPILKEEAEIQVRERTACERIIEGYKDLTFEESAYIFDTSYEATKENV